MNFKDFNINLIPAINEGYTEYFSKNPNIIGASEIPMGMRSNVLAKKHGLELDFHNKLLAGKQTHYILQKKKVMETITRDINKALGYTERVANDKRFIELQNGNYMEFKIGKEKKEQMFFEILPGKIFRITPDINTSLYAIEIKSTTMPTDQWKDLAAYQIQQLNSCLGFKHHEYGFLWKVDRAFLKSESYVPKNLWNKYFFLYPFNFNQELFDFTLNRLKTYFNYLDNEDNLYNIPCPEKLFECSDKCRKFCPNPIEKIDMKVNDTCFHCGKEIRVGTKGLLRNDRMYHCTDGHRNRFEGCISACKKAYLEVKVAD